MKRLKFSGAAFLVLAGYLLHALITSHWQWQGKVIVGILILFFTHLGMVFVLAKNGKSFKETINHPFEWLNYLIP